MAGGHDTSRVTVGYPEALSALPFVSDTVEGQPQGRALCYCSVGMTVGEGLRLDEGRRSGLFFYAPFPEDAGCSPNASKATAPLGSVGLRAERKMKTVDWSRLPNALLHAERGGSLRRTRPFGGPGRAGLGGQAVTTRAPSSEWICAWCT